MRVRHAKRRATRKSGIDNPNSKGQTREWASITATFEATLEHGSPSPQDMGEHRRIGANELN